MPARPLPGHGPGPQPIGKALDVVMRSLGAPEASGVHLVFDRWADVVGEALAARTKPLKIEGKRLVLARSEEHTSELQSLMRISYAVFCLKKKTTTIQKNY